MWHERAERAVLAEYARHKTGRGLWKWMHYYEIYERHLGKFVGEDVNVVEIGVYSGGSLDMWRDYLGPRCHIYGVDVAEQCRSYSGDQVSIMIGDQADPAFWREFLREQPKIDIVVDDGGHELEQQITTLEALLPRLSRGGVYICEDIAGVHNPIHDYLAGMYRNLDAWNAPDRRQGRTTPDGFQRGVASIHRYPYLLVIERAADPPNAFVSPRFGNEWQPF